MFDPNNPMAGQMHAMGQPQNQTLGAPHPMDQHQMSQMPPQMMPPQGQPVNALLQPPGPRPMFDHTAFQALTDPAARHDFRGDFHDSMQQWHDAFRAYRHPDDMNMRHGMQGGPVMTPGGGTTGAPLQGGANNLFPLNPAQQIAPVGQSLYVQGVTPPANPYGMPTY